jgi:hypothetical protein
MSLAPFVHIGTGVHPTVDRESLMRCYPDLPLDVWNISSASDLIGWEKGRTGYKIEDTSAVPCDLFIWGVGEPPDRRLTRVGGVPWLPRRTPWPAIDDVVTTFLCQFDLRDSRDLIGQRVSGDLPGDLLLVFVADESAPLTGDAQEMRFVWVSAEETDIVTAADVPKPTHQFDFVTAWGVRYRTADIPSKWKEAYEISDDAPSGRCWMLPVLWGTKIGGVPYNSQENHTEPPPGYLCQLISIQASETRWPWVDRELPLQNFGDNGIYEDKNSLMIGDMGELTLFLHNDGSVSAEGACG